MFYFVRITFGAQQQYLYSWRRILPHVTQNGKWLKTKP